MLEMLGALAIIGMLSIVGLYMYTIAMRHHRANEILDDVRMFAGNILHRNKKYEITKGEDDVIPREEFEKVQKVSNVMKAYQRTTEIFGVVVYEIDSKTCRVILNKANGSYPMRVQQTGVLLLFGMETRISVEKKLS